MNSQQYKIDSLESVRKSQEISSKSYWSTTVDMANYYIYRDLDRAENLIDSVFSQFIDEGGKFDNCYHRHLLLRSWVHHGNNRLKAAITTLSAAEKIVADCGKRKDEIEIQINKASLLIGLKDTSARDYVHNYMAQIDTSLDRNEKIAWIQGKYYLGDLDESRGYYRTALENYVEVFRSGVLDEIPKYRLGIIKGIARSATEAGDYSYAIETLNELMSDKELFTYQQNNIRIAQAINYYKIDRLQDAYKLTDEILASENISAQDKIEAGWVRVKVHLSNKEKEQAQSELAYIVGLKDEVQDKRLLARINLLRAEVSSIYETPEKTNKLLSSYSEKDYGSAEQNLKADRLWLTTSITGTKGNKLDSYLQSLILRNDEKSSAQLQEMMAIHKVEQSRQEKLHLEQNLINARKINSQRLLALVFSGVSAFLSFALFLVARRKAKIESELNQLLADDKNRLAQEKAVLTKEKENLVFRNQELIDINQKLENQKNDKAQILDVKVKFETRDKSHFLELSKIIYFKAEKDGVRVYLKGDLTFWSATPLKHFTQALTDKGIVRIFRGTAVNLNHIEWINHSTLKMDNGDELKVGRTYKDEIIAMFKKYKQPL